MELRRWVALLALCGALTAWPGAAFARNDVTVISSVPGTGATSLGKAVDSAAGATDTGVGALVIRDDALTTLTPVDGDYTFLRVSSTGALHVTGGGGGTEYNEDDATPAPIVGTAPLVERDDALTVVTPVEADWIGLRGTAEGALWVQDFNSDSALIALQLIDNPVQVLGTDTYLEATDSAFLTGCVRNDTLATLANTDNEIAPCQVSATGAVYVNVAEGSALGGAHVDKAAFTVSTDDGTPNLVMMDDAAPSTLLEGEAGVQRGTANRAAHVTLRGTGANALDLNTGARSADTLRVTVATDDVVPVSYSAGTFIVGDGAGALNVICDSGCAGGVQFAEDTLHATGDTGTMLLGVENADQAALTAGDKDYTPIATTAEGNVLMAYGSGTFVVGDGAGALNVICDSGCAGGTQFAEDVGRTTGDIGTVAMVIRDDVLAANAETNADLDYMPLRSDNFGSQWVALTDSAGARIAADATNGLKVDLGADNDVVVTNAGTFVVQEDGAALTALQLIDNPVQVLGTDTYLEATDSAFLVGVVRNDALATLASLDNEVAPLQVNASGAVYTALATVGAAAQAISVNDGTADAGTLRVTIASDTTGVLSVDDNAGALTVDNAGTFATQVDGAALTALQLVDDIVGVEDVAETAGGGLARMGSVRRDVAATSSGADAENATINTDALGLLWTRQLDPCSGVAKSHAVIDITTATTTEIINESVGNKVYICSLNLVTTAASNITMVEDATDACADPDAAMIGGLTAAEGWNFAANSGIAHGSGGSAVFITASTDMNVCLLTSASTQVSGSVIYAYAP